jgi:hypothetical protein
VVVGDQVLAVVVFDDESCSGPESFAAQSRANVDGPD